MSFSGVYYTKANNRRKKMYFTSTRADLQVTAAQAIAQGISSEGGLFVPSEFPAVKASVLEKLVNMNYKERAAALLSEYLTGFTPEVTARVML